MNYKTLGIDIGSSTVKIANLDENENLIFADYKRHFANIQETLADLLQEAFDQYGEMTLHPVITGSGGLTLANIWEFLLLRRLLQFLPLCRSWHQRQMLPSSLAVRMPRSFISKTET